MPTGGRINAMRQQAGHRWRVLRQTNQWDLRDVENETAKLRPDDEFIVRVSQLSHIEKGDHGRVSLDDAAALGAIYGLSPTEVFEMYDVPIHPKYRAAPEEERPQALVQAELSLSELSPEIQRHLLERIRYDVMDAKQLQNEIVGKYPRHRTEPPAAKQPVRP